MQREILEILRPQPGEVAVDCTLGFGGHSLALADGIGPTGTLLALDLDAENLAQARERLAGAPCTVRLEHLNFAGLAQALASVPGGQADMMLADLGVSSMQIDDPGRGFSYSRSGPLDMRMDRSRGKTAAQILQTIAFPELASALKEWGDEPYAEAIANAIVLARSAQPLATTYDLATLVQTVVGEPTWQLSAKPNVKKAHPAARTFQALRILVNRELANLTNLLRIAPDCLRPGGRLAIICFHSGEDRLVKNAFRDGQRAGQYRQISDDPLRPTFAEKQDNPRARSAKVRWAIKA